MTPLYSSSREVIVSKPVSESDNDMYIISPLALINETDFDASTVKKCRIWNKFGKLYKCSNCNYIPTFIKIQDLKYCPKCCSIKTFYEDDNGELVYMGSNDLKEAYQNKNGRNSA